MAKKNTNLNNAKKAKNDEFYTQLSDIEKEMSHYKDFFKGKVVFCNCDDARESNFFQYFALNFEYLGLKKLICIGYKENGKGILLEYEGDKNGNKMVDEEEIIATELEGDGDFRSEESIKYLKECDVVVTNPPFSLFREYVTQLMEYGKKFIVVGNKNAITYNEIFPHIKNDEIWLGASITSGDREFQVPNNYVTHSSSLRIDENGNKFLRVPGVCWFTNLVNNLRNTPMDLYKTYNSNEYLKYDNYDAIEVSKTSDIPMDYNGVMGVPITFLFKYCPTQFEIVDRINCPIINETKIYKRLLIRRKKNEEIVEVSTDNGTEVANIITDNTPNEVVEEKKPFFKRIKVVLNKIGCALLSLITFFYIS